MIQIETLSFSFLNLIVGVCKVSHVHVLWLLWLFVLAVLHCIVDVREERADALLVGCIEGHEGDHAEVVDLFHQRRGVSLEGEYLNAGYSLAGQWLD